MIQGLKQYGRVVQDVKGSHCGTLQTFNLQMSVRASAPYEGLRRYNIALTATGTNPESFPVEVTRHHIIPYNQLRSLWNLMITSENLTNVGNRLFESMIRLLENQGAINLIAQDRAEVANLLNDIRGGRVTHDPNGRSADGWDSLQQVYAWLPGNLFIGPSLRTDDPGEGFEATAATVVDNLGAWERANTGINLANNTDPETMHQALEALSEIIVLRNEPFPLDASNWVRDGEKYKLKG